MKAQVPRWLRPLLGKELLWKVGSSSKVLYLTFDDGPIPEVTPQVLSILDHYGWKATFFCVGENVMRYPELYQRLIDSGHRTGNHTFNHLQRFKSSLSDYIANVYKARERIESDLFRPPHGQITRKTSRILQRDFRLVMWDVLTYDYDASMTEEAIMNLVRKELRPGSIVVFHDSLKARDRVLKVLPKALEYWKLNGYTFGLL
jgi:peptidoglycan/xylan/chitin deacetylase (PgdA/CDA1 family)